MNGDGSVYRFVQCIIEIEPSREILPANAQRFVLLTVWIATPDARQGGVRTQAIG